MLYEKYVTQFFGYDEEMPVKTGADLSSVNTSTSLGIVSSCARA